MAPVSKIWIKGRLIEYFQAAPEFDPKEAYSEILFRLQEFILSRCQEKPQTTPPDPKSAKYSQYRPAIKLPDDKE